ncbi:MAG TPA: cardiolipin synthase [Burkholderiales bacterium]|nr:cardiolipin synthase [Burkholderiales bacterium]
MRRAGISNNWLIAGFTFVVTAFAVLLIANLSLGDKHIEQRVETLYSTAEAQFRRNVNVVFGPALLPGNRAQALVNGDAFFPDMLKAIGAAQKTITFESYIYWSGETGAAFTQALIERARNGVKVHVLFDALGSGKIDKRFVAEMKAAGIEVEKYNPWRWDTLARMNNRTHRKIMVIDGRVGYTGGAGIGDEWRGNAQDPQHWRDTQYRVEGPVVGQMQAAFIENWIEVTGRVLHGEEYFPELARAGSQAAQFIVTSPGGGSESMQLMYLMSIAAAAESIQISAAYFVPDEVEARALAAAAKRGVRVQLIVPGPQTDSPLVRRASRSTWGQLLRAGVEFYEFQPTFFHCKVMVVDELWVSVGSTNFDARSFSVNDEANLNVYDREFAAAQVRIFDADLKRSRRVSQEEWENRPWTEKLWEHTVGLFSSQL